MELFPGNSPGKAGCKFIILSNFSKKSADNTCIQPAQTIKFGLKDLINIANS